MMLSRFHPQPDIARLRAEFSAAVDSVWRGAHPDEAAARAVAADAALSQALAAAEAAKRAQHRATLDGQRAVRAAAALRIRTAAAVIADAAALLAQLDDELMKAGIHPETPETAPALAEAIGRIEAVVA